MINLYKHTLLFIIQIKLQIVSHYQFVSCHPPKSRQYVPKNKSFFAMNRSSLFVDICICKVVSFLKDQNGVLSISHKHFNKMPHV